MAPPKRKRSDVNTRPITAFFERKRPNPGPPVVNDGAQRPSGGDPYDSIEDIDVDEPDMIAPAPLVVSTVRQSQRDEDQAMKWVHVTRMIHRRELGGAMGSRQSVASIGSRRRRQQLHQRLMRWGLAQFQLLPLELQLPAEATRIVQSHRLVSHCEEFYASCMAFDTQGVLLAAGSSNGILALYDFDEVFYRTINLVHKHRRHQGVQRVEAGTEEDRPTQLDPTVLKPIHMIFTGMEVQRIRWNPIHEDEIACCFANRNEIHLYNLQKFPSKPHQVLRASSRPSSGYLDLVFLPPVGQNTMGSASGAQLSKKKLRAGSVVAGDMDGNVRLWDLRFPNRPQWSVSVGSQPVNVLTLSHDKQFLICGTEGGMIMTYDVRNLVVPAFGSKPMPQRRAAYRLVDLVRPYLSGEALRELAQSMETNSSFVGVISVLVDPTSPNHIICQIRNQWAVVLDFHTGAIVKLHTPVKRTSRQRPAPIVPASVLHSQDVSSQHTTSSSRQRHSWLHHHRCAGAFLFHGDALCAGAPDNPALTFIDLNQLERLTHAAPAADQGTPPRSAMIERLSRFQLQQPELVTAVAAHPSQHWIICGGADLRLRILGIIGDHLDLEGDQHPRTEPMAIDDQA
ncbi:hypothetical protein Poli38472_005272 [Pythium oligandrum]|uniref:Uncharacterized protein n=1 Tax=Pythium oligandrum TaxID=41045 RepID=A0A8K1FJ18_PYTOL|nr:hypothetical protein Poli38472_005272 [Pythium oligandrum]|eukprot:TMW62654.1 hypothetical protein Poli38472_005272 [Pythium oligandrum]